MPPERHDRSEPIKYRQRNQRACGPCRKRKVKCDGAEPCATCVGYGYTCVYVEKATRQPQSASSPVTDSDSRSNATISRPVETASVVATGTTSGHGFKGPFMAQESMIPQSSGNVPLLQHIKTRFTSAYSAIAWPKRLGISLGLPNPPRLQAFGWNPGLRAEFNRAPETSVCQIIDLAEMKQYAELYFQDVHPFFAILDPEQFSTRSTEYWTMGKRGTDFEACICGVVALGSYFSKTGSCQAEAQIVEHGRKLLDLSVAFPPAMISIKHVVGWVLRAIYLRLTTRPHISWMASCTAVHLTEAIGLHREISEIEVARHVTAQEIDLRRRTFWVAIALNEYYSSEYGRSRVALDSIVCQPLLENPEDLTFYTIAILRSVPAQTSLGSLPQLIDIMNHAMALPTKSPFLGSLRADACFCIYRMLCSTGSRLPNEQIPALLEVVRVALDANKFLRSTRHPWWNMVSMPFHSICVLLSIGSPESLGMVPLALKALKNTTALYNTHLSREALGTALLLVQGARDKRTREINSLDQGLSQVDNSFQLAISSENLDWQGEDSLQLPDFLDLTNYYGMDELLPQ
ncbi:fungal-specific transcription factor domain-containing protein [Bisporella sp. PMI_857]|nr:fungal-specific transcription factor domain-containing protein [Bisporella sp. PMI_857]